MDIITLYLLLALGIIFFLISLICAVLERASAITVFSMLFAGLIFWIGSNAYVSGTLTRLNTVTGVQDILRDGIASDVLMLAGLLAIVGFGIQIWQAISTSGVMEELGE